MAVKTNQKVGKYNYYRTTKTIGRKLNKNGIEEPVRRQFTGKNKADAEAKYQAYMKKKAQGLDDSKQYFGIALENWINDFFIIDPALAKGTKDRYIASWKRYLKDDEISHQALDTITASSIQRFYNTSGASPSAIRKINNLLRRFYKYLELEGIARDCTGSLIVPKESKDLDEEDVITWTDEEVVKIFSGFDAADYRFRFRFLIVLAYYTGCRVGELIGLKYDDIDLDNNVISIKRQIIDVTNQTADDRSSGSTFEVAPLKSSSSYRTIPINEVVLKELQIHKKWHKEEQIKNGYRTDYIFTTSSGGFLDRRNIRTALFRYYDAIGIEKTKYNKSGDLIHKSIHTYRHTFATNLVKNGVSIQVASSLLGHADINMTAKYYVGVDLDQKRDAVRMLESIVAI